MHSTWPNTVLPAVTTGIGPAGHQVVHYQALLPKPVSIITDDLIDTALLTILQTQSSPHAVPSLAATATEPFAPIHNLPPTATSIEKENIPPVLAVWQGPKALNFKIVDMVEAAKANMKKVPVKCGFEELIVDLSWYNILCFQVVVWQLSESLIVGRTWRLQTNVWLLQMTRLIVAFWLRNVINSWSFIDLVCTQSRSYCDCWQHWRVNNHQRGFGFGHHLLCGTLRMVNLCLPMKMSDCGSLFVLMLLVFYRRIVVTLIDLLIVQQWASFSYAPPHL